MSEDEATFSERDEIEMLLPWYIGGRLEAADRDRVERYLAHHPEVRRHLELVREEQRETIMANEAMPTLSAGALDRLMAALPVRRGGFWQRQRQGLFYRAITEFFTAPTPRAVRFAAVAAAGLLLLEGTVMTALIVRGGGSDYETAAGRDTGQHLSFFIGFSDQASAKAIAQLLQDFDARIVDGPKPGAIYQITVPSSDRSASAQEALQRRLAGRADVVRLVLPAKE
jgi:hypothetical protein